MKEESADRFGFEWNRYSELLPAHEEQFRRWTSALPEHAWHQARFLDVGCGMGRNSYWPMKWGAAGGVAIDVDPRSLSSARQTLEGYPEVEIRQQSAYEIGNEFFDIVFAIGVIHHLSDPALALRKIVEATRSGGHVLIWVYGRENNGWIVWFLNPLRRALFSRVPVSWVHALSWLPAAAVWLMLRLGLDRIEYFRLLRTFSFRHVRAIVFDQMLPKIAHYWRRQEVEDLMQAAGLTDIRLVWVNEMSWSASGRHDGRA